MVLSHQMKLPPEYLVQFKCRSIDPGSLKEITNSSLAFDTPDDIEELAIYLNRSRPIRSLRRDKEVLDPNREFESSMCCSSGLCIGTAIRIN